MMFRERVSQDHLCGECLTEGKHVDFARSFGVYEKSLMHVIKAYKYKGKTQLAKPLGRLLFHLYGKCYGSGPDEKPPPDVIMPVPLHRKRLRERGFNQAYLILKEWPRLFQSVHPDSCPIIIKGGVVRKKRTRPQAGLDRLRRKANIKGAFTLSRSFDVNGKRVLLVDDVYTTGATAEECARVLLKGGAWSVDILTVSRTVS
jgi:ComF family protein